VQLHGESEKTMTTVGIVDSHVAVNPKYKPDVSSNYEFVQRGWVGARIPSI